MNEDRELLEQASKAAGIKLLFDPDGVLRDCTGMAPAMNIFAAKPWNPLTDDGDALRLAVMLDMSICVNNGIVGWTNVDLRVKDAQVRVSGPHKRNPDAATRRAIVYAAAEIGKAMP